MKLLALAAAALTLAACSALVPRDQHFTVEDSDYEAIAYHSLKYIEMRGPVNAFIVAPNVDPRVRNALKSQRRVSSAVSPRTGTDTVPEGYFVLTHFQIADGEAMFEGTLGTMRNGAACDLKFSIPWYIEKNNDWYNPSYKIESCEKREELE
jgi:hypothetical protein